jgi:hypothetical protein
LIHPAQDMQRMNQPKIFTMFTRSRMNLYLINKVPFSYNMFAIAIILDGYGASETTLLKNSKCPSICRYQAYQFNFY